MKKSIVISTRTDIIVVAKLAQFYDTHLQSIRPYTKSALVDACLKDYFRILKSNKMLDEVNEAITTETQAYKYLTLLGYNVASKDMTIPEDIFRNMRKESAADIEEDIAVIKKSLRKADENLS